MLSGGPEKLIILYPLYFYFSLLLPKHHIVCLTRLTSLPQTPNRAPELLSLLIPHTRIPTLPPQKSSPGFTFLPFRSQLFDNPPAACGGEPLHLLLQSLLTLGPARVKG